MSGFSPLHRLRLLLAVLAHARTSVHLYKFIKDAEIGIVMDHDPIILHTKLELLINFSLILIWFNP